MPLQGGAEIVKLNGPLVLGGDVSTVFKISPDNTRVIYRADQDRDESFELYSVPLQGTAPNTKISDLRSSNSSVGFGFRFTPDSGRIIYRADQDRFTDIELYGAYAGLCVLSNGGDQNIVCEANTTGIDDWDTQAAIFPGITQTVTFPSGSGTVIGAVLELTGLTHTQLGDLSVELISPNGDSLFVIGQLIGDDLSGDNSDYNGEYSFQDEGSSLRDVAEEIASNDAVPAGIYAPSEDDENNLEQINSFAAVFANKLTQGDWTVRFYDSFAIGGTGHLVSWRLTLFTESSSYYVIPLNNGKSVVFSL